MSIERKTRETVVRVWECDDRIVKTDVPFLTHMLDTLIRHSGLGICVEAKDLLKYDDHHLVEDVAIVLGKVLNEMFKKRLVERYAWSLIPMDESLALCSMDVSGRGAFYYDFKFEREEVGGLATENVSHFFDTLAREGKFTLHLMILRGSNDHHKIEALFKAFAHCLRRVFGLGGGVVSAKGLLEL